MIWLCKIKICCRSKIALHGQKHCFIAYIKTNDIYKDIAEDIQTRFDSSDYKLDKPLPKGKNKKVVGLMKDELGGKIMTKFVTLRANTYSYYRDDGSEDKKQKVQKSVS